MGERKVVVTDGTREFVGQIATIKSTHLGYQDHGIMTASLTCEWPGGGVSVGGYSLDTPDPLAPEREPGHRRVGTDFGLDEVIEILRVVGVDSWEQVRGQQVIVLSEGSGGWGSRAIGIAHLTEDRVLIFEEHAQWWREREALASPTE